MKFEPQVTSSPTFGLVGLTLDFCRRIESSCSRFAGTDALLLFNLGKTFVDYLRS